MHTTTPASSTKNLFPTSTYFYLPIPSLLVNKIILTIPTNTSFLYISAIFHLPIFAYSNPCNLHQKHFLPRPFSEFRLSQRAYEKGTRVRTDTVLISLFFLKVKTGVTGLTISDSLLARLRKLVHFR